MISFTKGLFIELSIRISRMNSDLERKNKESIVEPKFYDETIVMLSNLEKEVESYLKSPYIDIDTFGLNNIVKYNTFYERLQCIELFRFLVILHYGEPEIRFKGRISKIYNEINCLQSPPLITTISNSENYYWAYPGYDVIAVPYGEDNHLLNLPDLYHEIAHLIFRQYATFFLKDINIFITNFYEDLKQQVIDNHLDKNLIIYYNKWCENWLKNWLEEYCCDMIATFLVGPAFAWSNIKMATLSSSQERVYAVSNSHPSDESRMQGVFSMLNKMGYGNDSINIQRSWAKFLKIIQNPIPKYYKFIFPEEIIKRLCLNVYSACILIDLRNYSDQISLYKNPTSKILNDAWCELFAKPESFVDWELNQIAFIDS